jgi:hypothetical protein
MRRALCALLTRGNHWPATLETRTDESGVLVVAQHKRCRWCGYRWTDWAFLRPRGEGP